MTSKTALILSLAFLTVLFVGCAAPQIRPQFEIRDHPVTSKPEAHLDILRIPFRTCGRAVAHRATETEEIWITISTELVGESRNYVLTPRSGIMEGYPYSVSSPAAAAEWLVAYASDEGFELDDGDSATFQTWAEENWMSPDEFHTTYGL